MPFFLVHFLEQYQNRVGSVVVCVLLITSCHAMAAACGVVLPAYDCVFVNNKNVQTALSARRVSTMTLLRCCSLVMIVDLVEMLLPGLDSETLCALQCRLLRSIIANHF